VKLFLFIIIQFEKTKAKQKTIMRRLLMILLNLRLSHCFQPI